MVLLDDDETKKLIRRYEDQERDQSAPALSNPFVGAAQRSGPLNADMAVVVNDRQIQPN